MPMPNKYPLKVDRRRVLLGAVSIVTITLARSPVTLADFPREVKGAGGSRRLDGVGMPRLMVIGVGGDGGHAVETMVATGLNAVDVTVVNDRAAATGLLAGYDMVFVVAGPGGNSATVEASHIAEQSRALGILTIGVVTTPLAGRGALSSHGTKAALHLMERQVDTLLLIPSENLYAAVRTVTDLMAMPQLIKLDFSDVREVMGDMGRATVGIGEAVGNDRAVVAAEAAISNSLPTKVSMAGARGLLISIVGGLDMTLFEISEAANRIRAEVNPEANVIVGSTCDEKLSGRMRVSVIATGIV